MSKVLTASCVGKVVTSNGVPVPGSVILSEGNGSSTGVLVLEEGEATYVTSNATDLKSLIEKAIALLEKNNTALTQIATALTSIDAKPTGGAGSAPTPVATSAIAQVNTIVTENEVIKVQMETLKGALK